MVAQAYRVNPDLRCARAICFATLIAFLSFCFAGGAAAKRRFDTGEPLVLGSKDWLSASVGIGDLDGDGDPDIAVANGRHWPQQNRLFFNQGRGRFNFSRPLGEERSTSYSTALADLDNDGDLDIAVGNDRMPNRILLNDGKGRFIVAGGFGEPSPIRSLELADIDSDGDIDILTNVRRQQNVIHLNDGAARFTKSLPFGSATDSTIDTEAVDLNGDGHPDLILANRDGQQNAVLLSDGRGGFTRRIPFGSGSDETRAVAAADFDGDGNLDWAAGNIGQSNAVYFGDGSGGVRGTIKFGRADGRTYSLAVEDMDRDGRPDIVAGNVAQFNAVHFNRSNGAEFAATPFGEAAHATYHVSASDLNQDGWPDIVEANSGARNFIYLNSLAEGDWPGFRGPGGGGVADARPLPVEWNADPDAGKVEGVLWQEPIPGLGHSSPVIWGDRLFICTAVSDKGDSPLTLGAGGRPTAANDAGTHRWLVICFDKRSGEELWRQVAREGSPRATRHVKATQANTSVAVDGRHVVAFFGSEGLYCYNLDGKLLWSRDFGVIDVSKYGIGWGYASSPALHGESIALVCDDPKEPFAAVLNLKDGAELWRVSRKGISDRSWGTPLIHEGPSATQMVINGWPQVVSYDLATGKPLWRIHDGGDNAIPTPFVANGWIYIASAHGPKSPIYVVRPQARGDITPTRTAPSNEGLVWSLLKGGSYMSTPVVYRGQIYLGTSSIVRSFDAMSGERIFEGRLPRGASVIASLVAGDGKIYCASEDGMVYVLQAGRELKVLSANAMGAPCLATPAISEGVLYFRTTHGLIAVRQDY